MVPVTEIVEVSFKSTVFASAALQSANCMSVSGIASRELTLHDELEVLADALKFV